MQLETTYSGETIYSGRPSAAGNAQPAGSEMLNSYKNAERKAKSCLKYKE